MRKPLKIAAVGAALALLLVVAAGAGWLAYHAARPDLDLRPAAWGWPLARRLLVEREIPPP